MAILAVNVQRFGVNLQATPITLSGSVFDVSGTKITILDSSGNFKSYTNGVSSFLNTTTVIPAFTAFLVLPKAGITTDDAVISFGTTISSSSASSSNSNWLM